MLIFVIKEKKKIKATFNGPLEFTTTLNHSCTTIKNLDIPSTVLLNEKSYQRIADKPIHSDIHDLLNHVSLEENSHPEAMAQTNYVEHMEKNQVSSQGQSAVSLDRYNEQIDSQDNQIKIYHTYVEIANSSSNQYLIILIPSDNIEANTAQQSEDNQKSISKFFKATKRNQGNSSQIDNSEDEIINDNSESSKGNEQLSEIQVEADNQQEQSDDSLLLEKNSKPLRVKKSQKIKINSSHKKERTQIKYTSLSEADSDEDESTSSDTNDITKEMQISSTINEIEKNKACLLNNNFEIVQKNKLIVYGDKLFSKNRSIEDLLIPNFSHLFNNINVINFSFPPLPSYSLNMESLENYFKEWASQYGQLKSTKTEVKKKILKLLYELRSAYLILLVMLAEEYK
ncbi:hypothetical protein F8M41_024828 [Gigaspora margarita]|uniref:Uncharacterized protein n=1 Tax=Gigaspora margarita TaxID=4874 RepID=A0A8H4ABR9_GIGMA|nr:hypothetical protein F8M41_024828 [Gigaspora margarita]